MEVLIKTIKNWDQTKINNSYIMAMDEVGRGSLFGPVTVGAIIFPAAELVYRESRDWHIKVRDSKKISASLRTKLSEHIKSSYLSHTSHVSVNFINKYNINKAIQYGVYRASHYLRKQILAHNDKADFPLILLDGNYRFQFPQIRMTRAMPPIKSIIKGDDTVFHISCASIIAKVTRDEMLKKISHRFPQYRLEQNAGYGTELHRKAISINGPTAFHRREYVKKIAIL